MDFIVRSSLRVKGTITINRCAIRIDLNLDRGSCRFIIPVLC